MEIGIFAKTFERSSLDAVLDAVVAHGIPQVQFNLSCAGLPNMPVELNDAEARLIGAAHSERGVTMAAVSGTFNMIHPDVAQRQDGLRRLEVIAEACDALGTSVITLCTGTRDPDNMWRRHPDNDSPEAWSDLVSSMTTAVTIAEQYGVTLGVEPEVANVIDSAKKARRLLDEIGSHHLKIVLDGANLFHAGALPRMDEILTEAIDLLGEDIVMAHAKDLSHDGDAGHDAAGTGLLDYDVYLAGLQRVGFTGPLVLHALTESQVPLSVSFVREKLGALPR